ncbi:MAG TPA: hypothetical protein VEF03_11965, partial [Candidatus Binataceae bacterium]|nr:hypothetical protein [Candidatus Binataceae bacterium]
IRIIPSVFRIGYSNGMLVHDPNLAEGVPVRDAPFVVRGRCAEPERTPVHALGANAEVAVQPWRQYRLVAEAKGPVRLDVSGERHRFLCVTKALDDGTDGWKRFVAAFNSLDNDRVRITFSAEDRVLDDGCVRGAELSHAGLLNIIRRDGAPLRIRSDPGLIYEEGRDFESIRDPMLGAVPWPGEYSVGHDSPVIALTPDSRIRDGQRLLVSAYHALPVDAEQVTCCLSHPGVYALLQDQLNRVCELLDPEVLFLDIDEIRVANWCELCRSRELSPGQLVAQVTQRLIAMVREKRPDAFMCTWSGMFEPHHLARDVYYAANGSLRESWEGLDRDVLVCNWNRWQTPESIRWFVGRGHRQIFAGYYDEEPAAYKRSLETVRGTATLDGAMYTTWNDDYSHLEAFARHAWDHNSTSE